MSKVELSIEAQNDLVSVWVYLAERGSEEIADRFVDQLQQAGFKLVQMPTIGKYQGHIRSGLKRHIYKNWPQFIYNQDDFKEYGLKFFENAGMLYGSLQHVDEDEQQALKVDLISDEAYKASEIEGEMLNRDSIHVSIRRQLGLEVDHG